MKNLIDRLVEYRAENEIKQEQMAKMLDITQGAYSRIESGISTPKRTILYKIEKILSTYENEKKIGK